METKMPVITLKQLPIIEEHLQLVKADIETRTKNAMQLVCTEETRGDVKKIRTELGWSPKVTFDEGMKKTISWYLDNKPWIASVTDGSYREYYEKMYGKR